MKKIFFNHSSNARLLSKDRFNCGQSANIQKRLEFYKRFRKNNLSIIGAFYFAYNELEITKIY